MGFRVQGRRDPSGSVRDGRHRGLRSLPAAGRSDLLGVVQFGDTFYWRTSPADPDAWPVVVRTDNADWIEFPVGAVEFLVGVYGRTIDVPGMPRNFPSDDPKVLGLSDRID